MIATIPLSIIVPTDYFSVSLSLDGSLFFQFLSILLFPFFSSSVFMAIVSTFLFLQLCWNVEIKRGSLYTFLSLSLLHIASILFFLSSVSLLRSNQSVTTEDSSSVSSFIPYRLSSNICLLTALIAFECGLINDPTRQFFLLHSYAPHTLIPLLSAITLALFQWNFFVLPSLAIGYGVYMMIESIRPSIASLENVRCFSFLKDGIGFMSYDDAPKQSPHFPVGWMDEYLMDYHRRLDNQSSSSSSTSKRSSSSALNSIVSSLNGNEGSIADIDGLAVDEIDQKFFHRGIQSLIAMGFDEASSRHALLESGGSVEGAVERLTAARR